MPLLVAVNVMINLPLTVWLPKKSCLYRWSVQNWLLFSATSASPTRVFGVDVNADTPH